MADLKDAIPHRDYLTLLGLKQVADMHRRVVDDCSRAIGEIIGEDEPENRHSGDLCWSDETVGDWLRARKIKVEAAE